MWYTRELKVVVRVNDAFLICEGTETETEGWEYIRAAVDRAVPRRTGTPGDPQTCHAVSVDWIAEPVETQYSGGE